MSAQDEARPAGGSVRRTTRRWPGIVLVAGIAVATVIGGERGWHWYRLPDRVASGLPETPELGALPPVLGEMIATARAGAASRATALDAAAELGRLFHANGFMHEAGACWAILQREQPREARWSYYQAAARRTTAADITELLDLLEHTIALEPDYAPAWQQIAELCFKSGQLDRAEAGYRRRIELIPGDPYARLGLARVALQQGRGDDGRRRIEEIIKDTPDFPAPHNLYAEILADAGDRNGAIRQRWLGREAGRYPDPSDPWLEELNAWCRDPKRLQVLGTMQYQTGRGDRGQALFERAIELAPADPVGYQILGELFLKLGDAARARDTFLRGLGAVPAGEPAVMLRVDLSDAHRMLGQPAEALLVVERGLALASESYELYNARGAIFGDLRRHEDAIAAYRAALALAPGHTDSTYNLGLSLLALGRMDEGRRYIEKTLDHEPSYPKALLLLGRMELEAGNLAAAGPRLRTLYESHPGQDQARVLMALWCLRSGAAAAAAGDTDGAEKLYIEGLAIDPEMAELNASLGVQYLVEGRIAEALGPLEAYHRLAPRNPQSALFLGQVYALSGRTDDARRMLAEGERIALATGQTSTAKHCREILDQLR